MSVNNLNIFSILMNTTRCNVVLHKYTRFIHDKFFTVFMYNVVGKINVSQKPKKHFVGY